MTKRRNLLARVLKSLLLLAIISVLVGLGIIRYIGAWNLVFPTAEHETVAPHLPGDLVSPAVLVFSKTNAFRHKEGIAAGKRTLESIAGKNGWGVFSTENSAVFNAQDLSRFDAVVFLNVSGDVLSSDQEQAFQAWLEGGGGWLGIHAAGDDSHSDWQWYVENLIGAKFTAHIMGPQFQRASVVLENHDHPALDGLPNIWEHKEEWYSWERSPRVEGFTILSIIDEESYTPVQKFMSSETDLRMGDHPVVWSNCVGRGRSLYAAMGHQAEAYKQAEFRRLIKNALSWLMGQTRGAC
jgi:type 1 glutamine amidotransferase